MTDKVPNLSLVPVAKQANTTFHWATRRQRMGTLRKQSSYASKNEEQCQSSTSARRTKAATQQTYTQPNPVPS
jgi:hypothetical protein